MNFKTALSLFSHLLENYLVHSDVWLAGVWNYLAKHLQGRWKMMTNYTKV
jgi:hypothetical protein